MLKAESEEMCMFDILVAEDDFKLNRIYCSALQDADFHTFAAYNGEEALEIVEEHANRIQGAANSNCPCFLYSK